MIGRAIRTLWQGAGGFPSPVSPCTAPLSRACQILCVWAGPSLAGSRISRAGQHRPITRRPRKGKPAGSSVTPSNGIRASRALTSATSATDCPGALSMPNGLGEGLKTLFTVFGASQARVKPASSDRCAEHEDSCSTQDTGTSDSVFRSMLPGTFNCCSPGAGC